MLIRLQDWIVDKKLYALLFNYGWSMDEKIINDCYMADSGQFKKMEMSIREYYIKYEDPSYQTNAESICDLYDEMTTIKEPCY